MSMFAANDHNTAVVIRLGHLGDVALTTGVLAYWHRKHGTRFTFITKPGNAAILENHPAISRIIRVEDHHLKGARWITTARDLACDLTGQPLIDLHGTLRSKILSMLWHGQVYRYPKFGLERRLFDKTKSGKLRAKLEATTVPQRYSLALESVAPPARELVPNIVVTDRDRNRAPRLPERSAPLIALHPYATHPAKTWPRDYWINLTVLLKQAGYDWIIVGRDQDKLLPSDERDLTNSTDLRATCALLEQAGLLVTGDSGPMHLASGVGTPVLALFGPTARVWGFYPSAPQDRVLELEMPCRPCSLHGARSCSKAHACMTGITPESVLAQVRKMIST